MVGTWGNGHLLSGIAPLAHPNLMRIFLPSPPGVKAAGPALFDPPTNLVRNETQAAPLDASREIDVWKMTLFDPEVDRRLVNAQ